MIAVRLGELYRSIHDVTTQLERRAFDKPLPSAKPRVNRVFRRWLNAWTPSAKVAAVVLAPHRRFAKR